MYSIPGIQFSMRFQLLPFYCKPQWSGHCGNGLKTFWTKSSATGSYSGIPVVYYVQNTKKCSLLQGISSQRLLLQNQHNSRKKVHQNILLLKWFYVTASAIHKLVQKLRNLRVIASLALPVLWFYNNF